MTVLGITVYAQKNIALDIPNTVPIIRSNTSHNEYDGLLEDHQANKVNFLMNLDIIHYYNLEERYDTELKRKVFKESEEGKELLKKLKELRQKTIDSPSYFIFPLSINYGRTQEGEYNLKTKTFDITFETGFPPIPGYVSFPYLAIKCNTTIKQYPFKREKSYRSVFGQYEYFNTIKLPMSEKTAITIEENIGQFNFVLEFKIRQAKISDDGYYILQGTAINMYIVDKDNYEIYYTTDRNRLETLRIQQEKIKKQRLELEKEQKRIEDQIKLKEQRENERKESIIKEVINKITKSETSIDSLVKVYVINALLEDAFENFIAGTKKQCYHPEVLLSIDSIKGVQLVAVEINYKNEMINKDLFDISINKQKYLRFKDHDYYLAGNKIFTNINSNIDVTIILAEDKVKNKKGKLKFDKRFGEIPPEIKEWCSKNLMENGSFMVQYAKCDTYYKAIKTKIK